MMKSCENCKRFFWEGRWSSQGHRHSVFGVGLSHQALDFLDVVLSYESKPGAFALRRQPLSRCDITFLVLLVCFLESDYRSRGFPNETFVSVNRYFTQPLKCRILKPVFVWPANILSQSLQLNKWGRFKWLLEKLMLGLSAGTSG